MERDIDHLGNVTSSKNIPNEKEDGYDFLKRFEYSKEVVKNTFEDFEIDLDNMSSNILDRVSMIFCEAESFELSHFQDSVDMAKISELSKTCRCHRLQWFSDCQGNSNKLY